MFSKVRETIKRHSRIFMAAALAVTLVVAGVTFKVEKPQYQGETTLTSNVGVVLTIGSGVEASSTADYTCTGVNDHLQLQVALNALPAVGGKLVILAGNYVFGGTVSRAINNVTIEGMGNSTYFANNGAAALFSVGAQTGWVIRDIKTDAGGITNATNATLDNVTLGATYYAHLIPSGTYTGNVSATTVGATTLNAPTGRTATYVIAASDAPAHVKAQADYVCDGIADNVEIQTAMDIAPLSARKIILSSGYFNIAAPIDFTHNDVELVGQVGYKSPVIKMTNGVNITMFRNSSGVDVYGCGIRNLYIDGNVTNNPATGVGVLLDNLWAFKIYQVQFADLKNSAIYNTTTIEGLELSDVTTSGNDYGVNLTDFSLSRFQNVYCMTSKTANWNLNSASRLSGSALYSDCSETHGFVINGITDSYLQCNSFDSKFYNYYLNGAVLRNTLIFSSTLTKVGLGGNVKYFQWAISDGVTCYGNTLDYHASGTYSQYALDLAGGGSSGTLAKTIITGDISSVPDYKVIKWSGFLESDVTWDLKGWINPGQIRTASGSLTAGNANAIGFAWHNPEVQDILITKVTIEVTTGGGTGGSQFDVGIADAADGTNRGTEFFDDLLLNDADVNDSWTGGDGGMQTKWVFCQDSASATDGWIVGQILTQNAAALVGKYYITYCGR